MGLVQHFNDVIRALNIHKVDYILIGGYAVILYGLPRTTQDMDLILRMTEENVAKFRKALKSVYKDDSEIEEIKFTELNDYAVIRYGTPSNFYIDIMARIGEIADYEKIDFQEKEVNNLIIKVATPEALFKLKNNTIRPQDKSDAIFLKDLINNRNK